MTANSDTPRTDEVPDWNARCNTADDNQIITNAFLLAHAHDESEELRILSRQLERELSEARAKLETVKRERDAKGKENDALRAMQVGVKCAYGYRMENGACQLGYPGCACMDDLCATIEWGPDDLHAQANKRLQERALAAEAALEEARKALKHQRTALYIVKERQRDGDVCWVSIADIEQGIAQLDAAIDAAMSRKGE